MCGAGGPSIVLRSNKLFGTVHWDARRHRRRRALTSCLRSTTPCFVALPTGSLRYVLCGIVFDRCRPGSTPNAVQPVETVGDRRDIIGGQSAMPIDRHGWQLFERSTSISPARRIATGRLTSRSKITIRQSSGDRLRRFFVVTRTQACRCYPEFLRRQGDIRPIEHRWTTSCRRAGGDRCAAVWIADVHRG